MDRRAWAWDDGWQEAFYLLPRQISSWPCTATDQWALSKTAGVPPDEVEPARRDAPAVRRAGAGRSCFPRLRCFSLTRLLPGVPHFYQANLARDGLVCDLCILGKQERLGEDDGEHSVSLEWEKEISWYAWCGCRTSSARHNAEILVVWLHQDIARAQVNPVGTSIAPHLEVADRPSQ
jgi:hypothetical protein